ncbi:TlpA family protein disulfide reductase [Enhygromyxa salina]|uniref:TlpA family protein disulfide reductase n=1 Tax=Enhygromyxa salina TaxID=215803 RepID=UPI0015E6B828|nr:redoxin domain-containing protein [Enhygromyxa salina]
MPGLLTAVVLVSGCDVDNAGAAFAGDGLDAGGSEGPEDSDGSEGEGETGDADENAPQSGCDAPSPYMGGWDIGCCQAEVTPSEWAPGGVGPGTVIPDWTFTDQFGDAVRVYDFCHQAIYFEYAAMWCGACQGHAPEVANLFNSYEARGLMTLTYMSESVNGGPATQADVQAWASDYGQAGLVVFSSAQDVWYPFGADVGGGSFSISLPGTMLVGTGGKIARLGIPTIQEIELVIPGE